MVLAELSGGVAEIFENLGQRRVLRLKAEGRAWQTDLGQSGTDRRCPVMKAERPAVQLCSE